MNYTPDPLILVGEPRPHFPLMPAESFSSKLSGNDLRRVSLSITLQLDAEAELLIDELRESQASGKLIEDTAGRQWRVETFWTTQNDQRPTVGISVEFVEHEVFVLDAIEFEGVRLTPEEAVADVGDSLKTITLRVEADAETHRLIEAAMERRSAVPDDQIHFTVTSWGSLGGDRVMRFGRCLWEPLDDGRVRHVITLVSQDVDLMQSKTADILFQPTRARMIDRALVEKARTDKLIDVLHKSGVLTDEALAEVHGAASSFADTREFDRAMNVALFMPKA